MKAIDRIKLAIVVVLLITGTNVFANTPNTQRSFENKYISQVVYTIDNSIPSVVESSIGVLLQLKSAFPNENYSKIVDKLDDLASNGSTLSIRYKAQLARIYFNYYDHFKDIKVNSSMDLDKEQVFKMIANKIEDNTFAAN
jgi:hypothetical protein